MMQYLVVESDPMDPLEAQKRLQQLADYLALDSHRAYATEPTRHVRSASVHYPIREVEIIHEDCPSICPLQYGVQRFRPLSRSYANLHDRVDVYRSPLYRLAYPSKSTSYIPYSSRRYPVLLTSKVVEVDRPMYSTWTPSVYYSRPPRTQYYMNNYWPLRRPDYGTYNYQYVPSSHLSPTSRYDYASNDEYSKTPIYRYPYSRSTSYSTVPRATYVDPGDVTSTKKYSPFPDETGLPSLDRLSSLRRRIRDLLSKYSHRRV